MNNKDHGKETGLARRLSPLNVCALAFGCIIGWGAFVMPGQTFLGAAGPLGTAIALLLAALIMLVIACNYHYMIQRYPVAGGEFTYAQQSFGNRHAFVCAWFLGLSYLAIVPLNGTALALIGRNLLHNIFQWGFHYRVAGYDVYCGEILLAAGALLLFAYLSIRGVKFSGVFQTALALSLVGGVVIVALAALLSPKASWASLRPAFPPSTSRMAGILAVVAIAPWAFVGFDTVPQAAEEFDFPPEKTRRIMAVSIFFGAAVYILLNTITAAAIPPDYASWTDYIGAVDSLSGLVSLPTFHAAYLLLGSGGLFVLSIAVLAAILSGIIGFYMAASRLIFSMSRERLLPAWFGHLHPAFHTPSHAILFVMGISLLAPFFGRTALGWIVDMSSLGAAIGYGYTSAAAAKLAAEEGNRPVFVTGILGVVFAVIFAVLLLVPVPGLHTSLGRESYLCLAVWIVMGLVFYRARMKERS